MKTFEALFRILETCKSCKSLDALVKVLDLFIATVERMRGAGDGAVVVEEGDVVEGGVYV